jgi:hypothetical protein
MQSQSQSALDSIDRFIKVGSEIARIPLLAMPQYRAAAQGLYEIAQKLLDANENMVRCLNRFLLFDFRAPDARARFLTLVRDYRDAKGGRRLRTMKFNCGDIYSIYDINIADKIEKMFPDDHQAVEEARQAFEDLGAADGLMVAFIWDTVVGGIDEFIRDAEEDVDRSQFGSAESRRLAFKRASAQLSEQLDRLAGGLSDLVLEYARLAHRPVTLT